jgi:hypothetical protein
MKREPLPAEALQTARFHTPTGLGEEAYQAAKLKQNKPMPVGTAGLPIPRELAIFQPRGHGKLLSRLVRASYQAQIDRGGPLPTHCRNQRDARTVIGMKAASIGQWPGQYKLRMGAYPKWIQIERAWPVLGEWLAEQRQAIEAAK